MVKRRNGRNRYGKGRRYRHTHFGTWFSLCGKVGVGVSSWNKKNVTCPKCKRLLARRKRSGKGSWSPYS